MATEIPGHYQTLATATAAGLTTGLINDDANFVTVTSASANNFITLPAGYIGQFLRFYVGANGCKVRTIGGSANTINTVDASGGTVGASVPANSEFSCHKVTATNWIMSSRTNAGAAGATITPA
jgi:hypothetical protein